LLKPHSMLRFETNTGQQLDPPREARKFDDIHRLHVGDILVFSHSRWQVVSRYWIFTPSTVLFVTAHPWNPEPAGPHTQTR